MTTHGFLGIDAGTQGLSVVFSNEQHHVIATGEGSYEMVAGLDEGCYEQHPADWDAALSVAMSDLRQQLKQAGTHDIKTLAIGISGQMHGEVLVGSEGECLGPARLWCDGRNAAEGEELTNLLGVKMPKRITSARWLWTTRNRPDVANNTSHLTTPAGWLAHRLTGQWNLGIGDASGMFPVNSTNYNFDADRLKQFDELVPSNFPSFFELLPTIRRAGEDGGVLNQQGAALLGLPEGVPVAPAEGDQPAALAGSLIADAGMVSVSFGTSVCANAVGDKAFQGVSPSVDHFCAVDGKPINMVFLRNGTTFMNTVVQMFEDGSDQDFGNLMRRVIAASHDCGGVVAIPFMDDEPGLGVEEGGHAALVGINQSNATPGNCIRATLTATIMNLKSGLEILDKQGFPRQEIFLTGGLTRTPELSQILADILETPVTLPAGADEGTAVGASLLASYRYAAMQGSALSWSEYLASIRQGTTFRHFRPDAGVADGYANWRVRYRNAVRPFVNDLPELILFKQEKE